MMSYFYSYLNGENQEANQFGFAAKLKGGDQQALNINKVQDVVRNSAFSDILVEKYGIEFSQLSFVIESIM